MYEKILSELKKNHYITTKCVNCGAESVLWFGFDSPCPIDELGRHSPTVVVESTKEREAEKLYKTFITCMYYDRNNFLKNAPREIKNLLAYGKEIFSSRRR